MSDRPESDERPAKRARLDPADESAPDATTVAPTSTEPPKTPIDSGPAPVDGDLEREVRAGITEYVCPDNLGFSGVLKQRYTDFLVNEIGLDGKVLHLKLAGVERKEVDKKAESEGRSDKKAGTIQEVEAKAESPATVAPSKQDAAADIKTEDVDAKATPNGNEESKEATQEGQEPSTEDLATLHSIFGEDATSQITALVRAIRKKEDRKAKDFRAVIAPPIADKETRTEAHKCLRRIFPNLLESSMEADQSIRIKAVPPRERKGKNKGGERSDPRGQGPGRRGGQLRWEELGGEFLHFTLYKENKDTMEVVGFIGSKLNTGPKALNFAGTKDRRACTVQRLCVKRQTAERMNGFNKQLFSAAIGDFSYSNRDIRLGDLAGNEFTITLRDCHFQGEENLDISQRVALANNIVSKAISDFSEKGFINYYGLQRFGSFAASTDTVGLKMLQGDLKGAVEDLLAYTDSALAASDGTGDSGVLVSQDDRNRAKALHIWKTTHKGGATLDLLPRKCNAERNIIQHLSSRNSKSGKHDRLSDWQGALTCIPRNLRLMYVHAYQSLVWNVVAGKRWNTYGDKVVEGDLVLVHEHKDKEESVEVVPDQTIDQNGEVIINPEGADSSLAPDEQFERARPLTAHEAASGKYTIFDIVLPQPGFDVEYPKNEVGKFYEEFMGSKRGGGLDPHNMRRSWRDISLSGGYRKFIARPLQPLGYEVRDYARIEEQFVETDLDRLKKEGQMVNGGNHDRNKPQEESKDVEMGEAQEGERKIAVVIKLQLGSSQYATIALRELMKAGGVKAYKPEFMGGR